MRCSPLSWERWKGPSKVPVSGRVGGAGVLDPNPVAQDGGVGVGRSVDAAIQHMVPFSAIESWGRRQGVPDALQNRGFLSSLTTKLLSQIKLHVGKVNSFL